MKQKNQNDNPGKQGLNDQTRKSNPVQQNGKVDRGQPDKPARDYSKQDDGSSNWHKDKQETRK